MKDNNNGCRTNMKIDDVKNREKRKLLNKMDWHNATDNFTSLYVGEIKRNYDAQFERSLGHSDVEYVCLHRPYICKFSIKFDA